MFRLLEELSLAAWKLVFIIWQRSVKRSRRYQSLLIPQAECLYYPWFKNDLYQSCDRGAGDPQSQ
jgi:hypothetical protein